MKLSQLLDEGTIKTNLESEEKEEVFEELVNLLVQAGKIKDRRRAVEALIERERLGTTGIGEGIGIPHAKDTSIEHLTAALGISRKGIEFDATDGKPVHIVFLVLAEANNPGPHIALLAEIARLFQTEGFYKELLSASTPQEALDVIKAHEQ